MVEQQTTADVLMIRPANFCVNTQTLASNRFQQAAASSVNSQATAVAEFDSLVRALRQAKVRVHVFDDRQLPSTPDALFPNNWVSFHADASTVVYPMLALNRRLERRFDILESLSRDQHFHSSRLVDLSHREADDEFLEGTGSVVLDRVNRIAYACLSPRTHLDVLGEFAQIMNYQIVAFEAADRDGIPIYHTNVLLSIGTRFAAVCADAIRSDQRADVLDCLRDSGHEIIELSYEQMSNFAGNILELATTEGTSVVALSERAFTALTHEQRVQLQAYGKPVSASIPTIEALGGGSVRCMLAEIHLPRAVPA
jgi:hypothetical protein